MTPAPVLLFAYTRLEHLRTTVESLQQNPEAPRTRLIAYSDAAKSPKDQARVDAVREYLGRIQGFESVSIRCRETNFGLAQSIIDGVSTCLASDDRVIVVEDDLLLSPHFLRYMNEALELYADEPRVASVHGYCYPVHASLPESFLLRGADCWGWATWRRAWAGFRSDGQALADELRSRRLVSAFDLDNSYPFMRMLCDQVAGRNNSWAIRWHASCFLANQLTLYPGRSLVHNTGNDDSGTHSGKSDTYALKVADRPIRLDRLPAEPSVAAREAFKAFFRSSRAHPPMPLHQRLRQWLGGLR